MLSKVDFEKLKLGDLMRAMAQDLKLSGIDESMREAQLICSLSLNLDTLQLLRLDSELLSSENLENVWLAFSRRRNREPIAYIFEEREFYGRSFQVGRGALVPRPETEHLIEWVLESHCEKNYEKGIDLCAGPGTIGLTLAQELKIPMTLVELSKEAMSWGEKNTNQFELESKVNWIQADVTEKLDLPKCDLIVSNPPYVPSKDLEGLQAEVRDFEPALALDGGRDGLDFMKQMLLNLASIAQPNCHLFLELGQGHQELLETCDFGLWQCDGWRHDLARIPRIVRYTFKPT